MAYVGPSFDQTHCFSNRHRALGDSGRALSKLDFDELGYLQEDEEKFHLRLARFVRMPRKSNEVADGWEDDEVICLRRLLPSCFLGCFPMRGRMDSPSLQDRSLSSPFHFWEMLCTRLACCDCSTTVAHGQCTHATTCTLSIHSKNFRGQRSQRTIRFACVIDSHDEMARCRR